MKQNGRKSNSIEKALKLILSFQTHQPVWGVRELGAKTGFSPATVQRILQTLKRYGFVAQDMDTRQYRLGNIYFSLLHVLQSSLPISRTALPFMKQLAGSTAETVHLNIVDGTERICIESIESMQTLKASMPIGSRSPLYAGASSKCLLAFSTSDFIESYLDTITLKALTPHTITDPQALELELKEIKTNGYATSLGEHNPGLGAISAPVINHEGIQLGAISLAIPEIRYREQAHREVCLKETLRIVNTCSEMMGRQASASPNGYPEVI
ncbi:MAG: IclR family transcriptional regulator [Desulfobacteraceae bacterium]|nr:IclR family transcriptional regulator [Desulfobacteraceae bacterium]